MPELTNTNTSNAQDWEVKLLRARNNRIPGRGRRGGRLDNEMIHVLFSVMSGGGGSGELGATKSAETGLSEV